MALVERSLAGGVLTVTLNDEPRRNALRADLLVELVDILDEADAADLLAALKKVKPSTLEWFSTARNFATYANEAGQYNDVLDYIKRHRLG